MQTFYRACGYTSAASDALRRAGDLPDGKSHRTCVLTGAAGDAVLFVPADLYQTEAVEPAVDGSQRTEILAEGAKDFHGEQEDKEQNPQLPEEQSADLTLEQSVHGEQRQCAHEGAGRTQVFAKCRDLCKAAEQEHGPDAHKKDKDQIFAVFQNVMKGQSPAFAEKRDPVEQILYQSKRTQPSAHGPSQQTSKEEEKAKHGKGNVKSPLIQQCLQCAHGTGTDSSGAGVAVQSRYTCVFELSLIDLSGQEAVDISVGEDGIDKLYSKTQSVHKSAFHPIPMHSRQIMTAFFQMTVNCP
jgi:hypothetical protein